MSSGEHHLHPTEHHLQQRLKLMGGWFFSVWSHRKIFSGWNPKVLGGFAFCTLHGTQSCKIIWTKPSWLFHVKVLFLLQIKSVDFWGSSRQCSKVFYEPIKTNNSSLSWRGMPKASKSSTWKEGDFWCLFFFHKQYVGGVCFFLSRSNILVEQTRFGCFSASEKNTHECDIWPLFQHFSAEHMKCRT